ncbi:MAG: RNA polymerase sigma factor [Planctomycetota bacterium]
MPEQTADDKLRAMLDTVGRRGFAYAWQLLRNHDDALDAMQTALTAVWAQRRRLQPGRDPRGWFYRVLRNKCIDMLRARRTRNPGHLESEPPARQEHDPVKDVGRHEELDQLRQALSELPEDMREIVLLRDFHDLPYAHIAEVLGIPLGTVMSRLHRARTTLADRVRENG